MQAMQPLKAFNILLTENIMLITIHTQYVQPD